LILLQLEPTNVLSNFHFRAVHLDIIKAIYSPTNAQVNCLQTLLKFTLK